MDIYENFIIGDFLFGLGVEMAFRHINRYMPPTLVNLFQQTPLDKSYADVIIKNPGVFRLLEFKRITNRSEKENAKLWMLKKGLRSSAFTQSKAEHLKMVSRKIHWYVEIQKGSGSTIRVVPYLDFRRPSGHMELADFVRAIAEEASTESITAETMQQYLTYLDVVSTCRGSKSSGALLILINNGQVAFEPVADIREVLLPREVVLRERMAEEEKLGFETKIRMERAYAKIVGESQRLSPRHELSLGYGLGG